MNLPIIIRRTHGGPGYVIQHLSPLYRDDIERLLITLRVMLEIRVGRYVERFK